MFETVVFTDFTTQAFTIYYNIFFDKMQKFDGLPTGIRTPMTGLEDLCTVQLCYREIWWTSQDLNLKPSRYERDALTN